jgi:adenylosuccinate synthase
MKRRIKEIKVVIGANYGDEGKGLMTDYFSDRGLKCLVVCNNGGAQRGHTVTHEDRRHVFHHLGSGTFSGADTYLSRYFILNPILFTQEYQEMRKYGIVPVVFRNPDCLWSTPYDMIINQIVEEFRGIKRHGSCGVGIWETIVRSRKIHVPLDELAGKQALLRDYLVRVREEYLPERLKELGVDRIPESWRGIINGEGLVDNYIEDMNFLAEHTRTAENGLFLEYDRVIFENGQGLLLDRNIEKFKEHTTPSNTGLQNIPEMLDGLDLKGIPVEVCYVTRTYLTRHGAGPFPGECPKSEINLWMLDETNQPNAFQGTLRYGIIDSIELGTRIKADFINYAHNEDYSISLAITHLNETAGKWNGKTDINTELFKRIGVGRVYYSSAKGKEKIVKEDQ